MTMLQFLASLTERLQDRATVKVVFGDPVAAEGKTVIPVARVTYGFGAGSRTGRDDRAARETETQEMQLGGGGGVSARPVGVVEVTADGTRFVSVEQRGRVLTALVVGLYLGMWLGRRRARRK